MHFSLLRLFFLTTTYSVLVESIGVCEPPIVLTHQPDHAGYKALEYTAPSVLSGPGIDKADPKSLKFNLQDGSVNRTSAQGRFTLNAQGFPLCPSGRTGIVGRGVFPRWGPTHAFISLLTRGQRDERGDQIMCKGVPVLELLSTVNAEDEFLRLPEVCNLLLLYS